MADYLGRPSDGDSPFAIGHRAMRDTSSPQPPQQRNPAPRNQYPQPPQQQVQSYGAPLGIPMRGYAASPGPGGRSGMASPGPGARSGMVSPTQGSFPPQAPQQQQQQQGQVSYQQFQRQYSSPPQQQQGFQPQQYQPRPQYGQLQQVRTQGYGSAQSPISPGTASNHGHPPVGSSGSGYTPMQQQQQQQNYGQAPQQHPHYATSPQGRQSQQAQQGQWGPQQHVQTMSSTPPMPSTGDNAELRDMFTAFDSSRSGHLSAFDLQKLLAKDATMDAREDSVKMLMNIFDTDRSGSINFQEFEGLYRYIQDWHGIFNRFDRDSSGLIDRTELHSALMGFGFPLPPEMIRKIEKRFTPPPVPGKDAPRGISFDRFLMACVTVKHYTEGFRRVDQRKEGKVTFSYENFMEMVLDAPA
ncbi:calcium-binding protein [Cryptococcus bacillisporus CA1873]|uniref:Calcium-binding protein n=1 Tax=Cryptococcus bacillisporus CA1873 TaxID=1296111 RepID=A0ABR5BGH8_CRYGA|nr:calcium-binding protein [Cryptococcus bacillisporus CA1873]|eukprot:KIR68278.1 calcium-binding protein [Cryptococcus gattii CA1873]